MEYGLESEAFLYLSSNRPSPRERRRFVIGIPGPGLSSQRRGMRALSKVAWPNF